MEGMFGDVNGADVNGGDGYAAVPLPVRKASGFPSSQQLIWRLGRPRQSLSGLLRHYGKPEAFRTGGGKAAKPIHCQPKIAGRLRTP